MDPLSIASGVAGLITLSEVVISRTYNTIIKCKNASEDACRLLREVQSLLGILQSVSTLERKLGATAIRSQIPNQEVAACQKTLQTVRDKLDRADPREDGITILQKAKRTLKWPISSSTMDAILAEMERHKSTFNLAVSVDTLDMILATSEEQSAMSTKFDQLEHSLQRLVRAEITKDARRMLQILGADSADGQHRANWRLYYPGTGLWFSEGPTFRDWSRSLNAKLWMHGIPGAGKTVLSALAIQEALAKTSNNRAAIFYYCSHQNARSQHLTGILSCFIGQLARQNEECLSMIQAKFEPYEHMSTPPWVSNDDDLTALLVSMFLCFDEISIIIDGIDECLDPSLVSETLARLCETPTVRLLVSSREEHHIKCSLVDFQSVSIAAESQDLRLFVPAEIETRRKKQKLRIRNPDLKDEMIEKLVNGAHGMFRWVACQLDHLCGLTTDRERILALQCLPPTLTTTYDRILERLNDESESACRLIERVLKWLIRPAQGSESRSWIDNVVMPQMSAPELCVAISINLADTTTSLDGIPSMDEVMIHASSLLRLSQDNNYVEFAHFTVEEYLRSINPQEKPRLARYRWDALEASAYQVETCLAFLNLDNFSTSLCRNLGTMQQLLQTHPFYFRASVLWTGCDVHSRRSERAAPLLNRLFGSPDDAFRFDNWLRVRILAPRILNYLPEKLTDDDPTPGYGILADDFTLSLAIAANTDRLHIAAMFHLVDQISQFSEAESEINGVGAFGTPLHCALVGHTFMDFATEIHTTRRIEPCVDHASLSSTIALLLKLGADVSIPFHSGTMGTITILYLATLSAASQQILHAGASLDEHTARRVIHEMDEPNPRRIDLAPLSRVPLESVSASEQPNATRLLMRINPKKDVLPSSTVALDQASKWTLEETLRDACENNQLAIFRWIFESFDFDVNHQFRKDDAILLHVACSSFAAEIVAYLCEKGADVNKLDSHDCRPLVHYFEARGWRHGSSFRRQDCLATLNSMVDYGARFDRLTYDKSDALMLWARCRSTELEALEEVLRVLSKQGIDMASRNAHGESVWHFLARHNRVRHAKVLKSCVEPVEFRSTIDTADYSNFTPIQIAANLNQFEMFDYLFEEGCDVTRTREGCSILHLAAECIWGGDDVLQSLLRDFLRFEIPRYAKDGYTIAHYCVKSITETPHWINRNAAPPPGWGPVPPDVPQRFKNAITALTASSISVTDPAGATGITPLEGLCQWIAEEGHHAHGDCDHCDACFECFEALVRHEHSRDEREQKQITWVDIVHLGLDKVVRSDDSPDQGSRYPIQTVCSRALGVAVERGLPLGNLVARFGYDRVFETAAVMGQEWLLLKMLDTTGFDVDKAGAIAPYLTPMELLCMHCCPASTVRTATMHTKKLQGSGLLHLLFRKPKAQPRKMAPLIETLIDCGIDVNEKRHHDGATALMVAAATGDSNDAVETLLRSGADVKLCDANGWNALLHACFSGTESNIKALVDAGCAILHRTVPLPNFPKKIMAKCGPVHLAAARGMTWVVKLLLESARSINTNDSDDSPVNLLSVACVGSRETVSLLLERGHDPDRWDSTLGRRPVHVAAWAGKKWIVLGLFKAGCEKEAQDENGLTPWMVATLHGHTDMASMIEDFVKLDHIRNRVSRPSSPIEVIEPMKHHEPDSPTFELEEHQSTTSGSSPHLSSFLIDGLPKAMRLYLTQGSLQVVKNLADGGLDMRRPFEGCTCTPMLCAVNHGHLEIVEYLVITGVPLFTNDWCSLHFEHDATVSETLAAEPSWTKFLRRWFCRPDWRSEMTQEQLLCVVAHAVRHGSSGTLAILLRQVAHPLPSCDIVGLRGPLISDELLHEAVATSGACVILLLEHGGLDVDSLNRHGWTSLQLAVTHKQLSIVTLLVSNHGASVNIAAATGGTALAMAAGAGDITIVRYLLARGADSNLCPSPEFAPLTCAANRGRYPAFRELLDAGGIPRVQDYYSLYDKGYRSVIMLDKRFFNGTQGPALLHYLLGPEYRQTSLSTPKSLVRSILPLMKAMSLPMRTLCFATPHPSEKTTALYQAAISGSSFAVDLMVQYDAAVNMEGGPEGTPLMAACAAGHLPVVRRLVHFGALLSYWSGTSHVSAFVKAEPNPKVLRWLLVGRFTEILRLTESSEVYSDAAEHCERKVTGINVELILQHHIEGYLERNFWFVSARRFVDSGIGSFDSVEILPSEFAKYKPGYF